MIVTIEDVIEDYFKKNYKTWKGIEKDFKKGLRSYKNKMNELLNIPFGIGSLTFYKNHTYKNQKFILFIGIPYYVLDKNVYLDYEAIQKYSIKISVFKD